MLAVYTAAPLCCQALILSCLQLLQQLLPLPLLLLTSLALLLLLTQALCKEPQVN
jgi:hypothetical protein